MKEKTNEYINELIRIIDQDKRIIDIKKNKEKLLLNEAFIEKLNKLKTLDIYSSEYKTLKKELFDNSDFVLYKQLENDINLLILEINQKLNTLTDKKGC